MSQGGDIRREWRWINRDPFPHPEHTEWDLIQWDLEDELVKGPRKISVKIDSPGEYYVLTTKGAPGLQHLPSMVVLFQITAEPAATAPGVIEGIEAWADDDLEEALLRRVQGRPTF